MMVSEDPVHPIQLLIPLGGCLYEINCLLKVKGTYISILWVVLFRPVGSDAILNVYKMVSRSV